MVKSALSRAGDAGSIPGGGRKMSNAAGQLSLHIPTGEKLRGTMKILPVATKTSHGQK